MKPVLAALPLAAAAVSAFVMPGVPDVQQALTQAKQAFSAPFSTDGTEHVVAVPEPNHEEETEHAHAWWDSLMMVPSDDEAVLSDHESHIVQTIQDDFHHQLQASIDEEEDDDSLIHESASWKGHHDFPDHTIYQLLHRSKYTTKLAKLVDHFPDLVQLLNSSDAGVSLLAPVDDAFAEIPDDHEKPDKEVIERVLKYHIVPGKEPLFRAWGLYTAGTLLNEELLGFEAQRIRISEGVLHAKVNFYNQVLVKNIGAKNGAIHAVRHLLVPPPAIGRELTLFPQYFSTLLLAYEKTDFVKYVHGLSMNGSTVFAPTNSAWARLGPRANAFLFNTELGAKYLRALLQYQIVPNVTVYTDTVYNKTDAETPLPPATLHGGGRHLELPTLLGDRHIGLDVHALGPLVGMYLNHKTRVSLRNGVAKNGVLQVTSSVAIPPHKHHGREVEGSEFLGAGVEDIDVEDLKARLAEFVDE